MNYTPNLNLKKPEGSDFYNVSDFNDNVDILDAIIHGLQTGMCPSYDSSATYNKGSIVMYNNTMYVCKVDGTTGTWDASKWTAVNLESLLKSTDQFIGGYLSSGNFYEDSTHTILITPKTNKLYIDLTNQRYIYIYTGSIYQVVSDWNAVCERTANKVTSLDSSDTHYPSSKAVKDVTDQLNEDIENVENNLDDHENLSIVSANGAHNLRYYGNKLQYWDGSEWQNATASGGVLPVIRLTSPSGSALTITDGQSTITGTSTGLNDIEVPNFGTWTVTAVIGSDTATTTVTITINQIYEISLSFYHVWGVTIDQSNSNPETSVVYTDDATSMSAGSSAWDTLFGYKPCLFINGAVSKYLNPNNFSQDENGNNVDITTLGNDVMIEFPKMGYKIETSGNIITIKVTDNPNADGYCYKPFSRNAIGDRNYFYYGAYKGYGSSSKLYSSSGKTPTANQTRATYRTWATARGTGYFQNGFYQLIFLQCLYILKYKNLNSQSALGYGYVGGSSAQSTGATNAKGMCYGNTSSQTDRMKLFGIEDFWGNIWQWFDGLTTDASRNLIVTHLPVNFDDATSGTAHTSYTSGIFSNIGGYMDKVQGGTDTGFVAKSVSGSDSTYFTDYGNLYASCVAVFGGAWDDALDTGVFRLNVITAASASDSDIASRLMYV